jgi:hypothetical protein
MGGLSSGPSFARIQLQVKYALGVYRPVDPPHQYRPGVEMVKLKNIDLPAALKERYGGVYDGTPVRKGFRDGSALREPDKLIQKACFPTYEGRLQQRNLSV